MLRLIWREKSNWAGGSPKDAFVAARHTKFQRPCPLHDHDFAEMFWIESGVGSHRINGTLTPLRPGSLIMIRPADCHGFEPAPGETLCFTNVSFRREVLRAFEKRYYHENRIFFWSRERLPFIQEIDPRRLQRLNQWADELSRSPRENLYIDQFLLNVLIELSSRGRKELPGGAPVWLIRACSTFSEQLKTGVPGFFKLCGRSHEHVSRSTRLYLKSTPTDYVNQLRMAHARHQLEMGDREILDISLDCGLESLNHFYRLFRRETGMTPRAYRQRHRQLL